MFGLMRPPHSCADKSSDSYRQHRMHYCGTCKTLGIEYGQRTRGLLNFDTVFFAEILSHLSKENLAEWQQGYQAINRCFTMPDKEQETPLSLQYAAAANVLLGELKIDDHIKDVSGIHWKMLRRFFSKPFRKANRQMQEWGLETDQLWHWINEQEKIERAASAEFNSLQTLMNHYAEPTAQMTGLIFQNGAATVGQHEHGKELFELGYQLGQLVYVLDAFEDVEKDWQKRQFNPLTLFFNTERTLADSQFAEARQLISAYQNKVGEALKKLPFSKEVIGIYSIRLQSNIALRIYKDRVIPKTRQEQMASLWETTIQQMTSFKIHLNHWFRSANYYMVSLVVFLFPLVADYGGYAQKEVVYKQAAILTSLLAAIGIGRLAWKQRKKRKGKKRKGGIRRFFKRLPLLFSKNRPCDSACGAACGEACCQSCCDSCGQYCCDELCYRLCENPGGGEGMSKAVGVIAVLLLIAIVVVMILILV